MKKDVRQDAGAKTYTVICLDTKRELPDVIWADDATGEYEQFQRDEKGKLVILQGGFIATRRKKGNIKLERISRA